MIDGTKQQASSRTYNIDFQGYQFGRWQMLKCEIFYSEVYSKYNNAAESNKVRPNVHCLIMKGEQWQQGIFDIMICSIAIINV